MLLCKIIIITVFCFYCLSNPTQVPMQNGENVEAIDIDSNINQNETSSGEEFQGLHVHDSVEIVLDEDEAFEIN